MNDNSIDNQLNKEEEQNKFRYLFYAFLFVVVISIIIDYLGWIIIPDIDLSLVEDGFREFGFRVLENLIATIGVLYILLSKKLFDSKSDILFHAGGIIFCGFFISSIIINILYYSYDNWSPIMGIIKFCAFNLFEFYIIANLILSIKYREGVLKAVIIALVFFGFCVYGLTLVPMVVD